jgi:GH25 family lysozyme M1 (1,4-beta-N-acetylmuramidase)
LPIAVRPPLRRLATKVIAGTAAVACLFGGAAYADTTGIDVSKWQHGASINWERVRADGVTFTFIKATEAANYTNPYFQGDWAASRRAGVYRGAYHFARPGAAPARRQAHYFVRKAGTFGGRGALPPVLDLESSGGLGVTALRHWTHTWLRTTTRLTGRKPIIYTSPYFWESALGNAKGFSDYPLWVAHYSTTHPRIPGGWTRWTFWQRSNTGRINGISGAVDINRFNGTRARLARLAQDAPAGDTGDTGGTGGTDPGTGTTPDTGGGTPSTGDGTTTDPDTGIPTEPTPGTTPEPTEPAPAPAKTTTAVSLRLSDDAVYAGRTVNFSGQLRTSTGQALAGRRVALYRRADGAATWTRIAAPTTGTDGRYAVSFAATASATFKTSYVGGTRYAESASRQQSLTVRPKVRTGSTLAVDRSAHRGRTAKVYGHLVTRSGRALAGRTMYVYQRANGATRWTLVERSHTLSPSGWYQAYVSPSRTSTYKAVFRGSARLSRSVSNLTTVRVR